MHSLNQTGGEAKILAPLFLRPGHPSAIGVMVHSEKMQHAVQHENRNLVFACMAVLLCLFGRALGGDGDIAKCALFLSGWKGKHVRGAILASKLAVEARELRVVRD